MKFFLYFLLLFFSTMLGAQQFKKVDFITAKVVLQIDPYAQKIAGEVTYDFTVLAATDTIAIEAQHMEFDAVIINGKPATYLAKDSRLQLLGDFSPQEQHTVVITYRASPQKAMYFMGWEEAVDKEEGSRNQVWTQGQGKYTSNWLPSFDDVNEKVIFDLAITFPTGYEVIANGKLNTKKTVGEHTIWSYEMQQPMSSYLLAIVAGDYSKKTSFSANNIPLEFYYYPTDEAKFEPTYRHSKTIFDFLESEIGVAYPWQNYKQIPVKDFLYAGMENTGTTIFSDAFVVDSTAYTDRNYSNVNAHELAHQWFGNLVTASESKHHWLQEGFATYYALLAERELLGEAYFYYKLYESAEQLDAQNRKKSTSLLDPKASSLTFYQRGAWALFALHNTIGATHFKTVVQDYLKQHQFKNATTSDFITLASAVSGMDLSAFQTTWLEAVNFPAAKALQLLEKSAFIKQYLTLAKQRTQPLLSKKQLLDAALQFPANEFMGQEAVYQLAGNTSEDALALYNKAFDTNNLLIRQGIATTCTKIPRALRPAYETLLDDASYATIEAALYHLWVNFPENRKRYLEKTKAILGFSDKNVRALWLVLAINTPTYQPNNSALFYKELASYTSPRFSTKTRENAFTYLEGLQTFSDAALLHLIAGATHHHWRFRNACRTLLEKLLQEKQYQKKYEVLRTQLSDKQRDYLNRQLSRNMVR